MSVKLTNTGFLAESGRQHRRQRHSRQDPPGDEQKLDTRPMTRGERAADREAEPEDRA